METKTKQKSYSHHMRGCKWIDDNIYMADSMGVQKYRNFKDHGCPLKKNTHEFQSYNNKCA